MERTPRIIIVCLCVCFVACLLVSVFLCYSLLVEVIFAHQGWLLGFSYLTTIFFVISLFSCGNVQPYSLEFRLRLW